MRLIGRATYRRHTKYQGRMAPENITLYGFIKEVGEGGQRINMSTVGLQVLAPKY